MNRTKGLVYTVTEKGIKELSRDMAREALKESESVKNKDQEMKNIKSIAEEASKRFSESHEGKDEAYIASLVEHGTKVGFVLNNITSTDQVTDYLEHVYAMKTGDYSQFNSKTVKKSDSKVDTTTMEKVSEGQKVEKGLGNVNSSDADNVDYDNMGFDDWEKLPRDKRNQLLGI